MNVFLVSRRRWAAVLAASLALASLPGMLQAAQAAPSKTIVVVGDSLSAEYGLKRGSGWVALLGRRLEAEKIPATVVNASISGETTAGGRSRLPALLKQHQPQVVVIELGGNDALRGLPLASTEDNLVTMAKLAKSSGAQVLIVGMQVPPNYGADYAQKFGAVFGKAGQAAGVPVVPFLLKGIADGPDPLKLFQADRIHPREEAHPQMLDNVWPELKKLLR